MKRIAIIGGGLGGLAAAALLARQGHEVRLFEANEHCGGKAASMKLGAWRFDRGPSLLTMIDVFDRHFKACGKNRKEYLRFIRLDPLCHYFWTDGTRFQAPGTVEGMTMALVKQFGEEESSVRKYFKKAQVIHRITHKLFLEQSIHDPKIFLTLDFWRSLFQILRIDPLNTLHNFHAGLFKSTKIQQLFDRYATYNGSHPWKTPATMAIIPWVEYHGGGYAVDGGIIQIPRAMEKLARECGTRIETRSRVTRILRESDKAGSRITGVVIEGPLGTASWNCEVVISNTDVSRTYQELLDDPEAPLFKRYQACEPSSSGMVFLWGMDRVWPELAANNMLFSKDYLAEFSRIFPESNLTTSADGPEEPSIYINISSKDSSADAPTGGENWFILVNMPYDQGQDWKSIKNRIRAFLIERISSVLGTRIEDHIKEEEILSPADIARETGSYRGSLYGISSNSMGAAFSRHPNRSKRWPGLYFCGGSCHPGGGMPLAILSGTIVANMIKP